MGYDGTALARGNNGVSCAQTVRSEGATDCIRHAKTRLLPTQGIRMIARAMLISCYRCRAPVARDLPTDCYYYKFSMALSQSLLLRLFQTIKFGMESLHGRKCFASVCVSYGEALRKAGMSVRQTYARLGRRNKTPHQTHRLSCCTNSDSIERVARANETIRRNGSGL